MPEFDTDFDSKNRRNASKKRDYSIHSRRVLKMFKKDDDNASKSECESNFVPGIEKMKKMTRKTIISMKISIGKIEIGKWSIKSKVKIKSIKSVDNVIKKHYT